MSLAALRSPYPGIRSAATSQKFRPRGPRPPVGGSTQLATAEARHRQHNTNAHQMSTVSCSKRLSTCARIVLRLFLSAGQVHHVAKSYLEKPAAVLQTHGQTGHSRALATPPTLLRCACDYVGLPTNGRTKTTEIAHTSLQKSVRLTTTAHTEVLSSPTIYDRGIDVYTLTSAVSLWMQ
jgi:hypothetical protein